MGNVGTKPDIKTFSEDSRVANFSIATVETYKKQTGEYVKQTMWHKVSVRDKLSVDLVEKFVHAGYAWYLTECLILSTKVCVEGKIQYRNVEKDNVTKTYTDIVVARDGNIIVLSAKEDNSSNTETVASSNAPTQARQASNNNYSR